MRLNYILPAVVLALAACNHKKQSEPTPRTPYTLSAPVEVIVDDWGNAHIYADNKFDAAFALCYQTAHDRMFQIDYTLRNVLGRLSEWFGDEKVEDDRLRKIIGFERIAQATWQQTQLLAPDVANRLWACSDGFNAYIDDAKAKRNGARFPPEYAMIDPDYVPPPVDPTYIVAVGKAMAFELSFTGDLELLLHAFRSIFGETMFNDLVRFQPLEATTIVNGSELERWGLSKTSSAKTASLKSSRRFDQKLPPNLAAQLLPNLKIIDKLKPFGTRAFVGPTGSNNWVVSGKHTDTGFPLIANDPHLGFELPPKFYEVHLNYNEDGENVDVQGITLAGAPVVLIGHNQHVGWGLTTTMGDVTDLYVENINATGDTVTWANGKQVKLINPPEALCVRPAGGKVADCRRVPLTVRVVPGHGPLLNDLAPGLTDILGAISVRWTGFEPTGELIALDRLNKAESLQEAIAALEHFQVGEQSFALADIAGNIGFFAPAYLPVRSWNWREQPPYLPLPGDGRFEWAGFQDYELVPQVVNPQKGYIVTANNDPLGTTIDNDPANDAFYFGHFFDMGARAQRITTRIEQVLNGPPPQKLTFADMQSIQADVHSVLADRLLPHLLPLRPSDAACAANGEPNLCVAFDHLGDWNRNSDSDATGTTLFHLWFAHLIRETFRDDVPLFDTIADMIGGSESQIFGKAIVQWLDGAKATSGRNYFDRQGTPAVETANEIMLTAMRAMLAQGQTLFLDASDAPDPVSSWTWDRFHFANFEHLWLKDDTRFSPEPYVFHGGKNNVDASDFNMFDENGVAGIGLQDGGPNMRLVMEVKANGWRVENAIPGGASGDPDDVHYKDQLEELWLKNSARPVPYTREQVEAQAVERKTMPTGFPVKN